jgi:hypothetical protein
MYERARFVIFIREKTWKKQIKSRKLEKNYN